MCDFMEKRKLALSLMAHPDDAEFLCAGTLALLHNAGWEIHTATMTPGDCGTAEHSREQISRIRRVEAAKAAAILDGEYHCLECDDCFIMYDRETILKGIRLLREVRPTVVFTTSPSDYMIDHETASKVAQTACFCCGMKNVKTEGVEPYKAVPYLYYADAVEGKDKLGNKIQAGFYVDIAEVMEVKERMLCQHASQRNWLLVHHKMDEYVQIMKRLGQIRGEEVKRDYVETFRQHLGHGYPQDNLLMSELGDAVIVNIEQK